ncbi:right-handed parallel beta-helix repeat-containing protein [Methanobrevibacter sp.]|uniref:right-handed parallel beta-helix repeat-containing protein n=1 Tax=Methanobrevibacter sp. TaxID=66852 RepID=UPI0038680E38
MGFIDKVKKALGSGKKEDESRNDENIVTNDIIDQSPPNEKVRNFKYLDNLIHSEEKHIILESDIILGDDEKSEYLEGIKLDIDDLVIDGNGFTIDAQGKTRIFNVSGNGIVLKNLFLEKGNAGEGGAIYNDGILNIINSTFSNNVGEDRGIIYNRKTINVFNSNFANNKSERWAGVIYSAEDSTVNIKDSAFSNNYAQYSAGAILIRDGEMSIDNTLFEDNNASGDGGGAIESQYSNLEIKNSKFISNHSKIGGAIELEYTNSQIDDCKFFNNDSEESGGSIGNVFSNLKVANSFFFNNAASGEGGAILNKGYMAIEKTSFENNKSNGEFSDDIFNEDELLIHMELNFDTQFKTIHNKKGVYTAKSLFEKIHNEGKIYEPLIEKNQSDFNYLNNLIACGDKEIKLDKDIKLNIFNDERDVFLDGITIDKDNLIIDGNDHTIDALGKSQIFRITGKNVIIKNINFKNSYSKAGNIFLYETAAVVNQSKGNLTIINSTFSHNSGVGVFNGEECSLCVRYSVFSDNSKGAILNDKNGEVAIHNSRLYENHSSAIHNKGKLDIHDCALYHNFGRMGTSLYNECQLNIFNSEVYDNLSGYSLYNKGTLNIVESDIYDNAYVAYNEEGSLHIQDSKLNNNNDEKYNGLVFGTRYGTICNNDGNSTIENCLFYDNAIGKNALIYNNTDNDFKIVNCEFSNNNGKGKLFDNNRGSMNISNAMLLKNDVAECIINDDYMEIHGTAFDENKFKYCICNRSPENSNLGIFYGKFLSNNIEKSLMHNEGRFYNLEKCTFSNNQLKDSNSNIIHNLSNLTLKNSKIEDEGEIILNEGYILIREISKEILDSIYGSGKIDIDEDIIPPEKNFDFGHLDKLIHENSDMEIILENDFCLETYESDYYEGGVELDIDDLVIDGNGHAIDGNKKSRIFIITGKNITLKNIKFKNGLISESRYNLLNNHGGAIRINTNDKLTIENCEFNGNVSENSAGAIYNSRGADLYIYDSVFSSNVSEESSAAIFNMFGSLYMEGSFLFNNVANAKFSKGGAIYGDSCKLRISNSFISENSAKGSGGAIYHKGSLSICDSTTLSKNTSSEGGAVSCNGDLIISDSILSENISDGSGGAIEHKGDLKISGSTFKDNNAKYGGGAIEHKGNLSISGSIFTKNNSNNNDGGAIEHKGDLSISDSRFSENSAKGNGGAVFNANGHTQIKNSLFSTNSICRSMGVNSIPLGGGGAIFDGGDNLNIHDSTFTRNKVFGKSCRGGAIYLGAFKDSEILNSLFCDNEVCTPTIEKPCFGGAVYNEHGDLVVNNSKFSNNKVEGEGGAIYNNLSVSGLKTTYNPLLRVSHSTFSKNSAHRAGGISSIDKKLELESCTFEDNLPDDYND